MMHEPRFFEVIIVGAGPIGLACALECTSRNLSYLVLEKGALVNSLYHYPKGMQFFSSSDKLSLKNTPFISKEPKPFRDEALAYYRGIAQGENLNIRLFERVEQIQKSGRTFTVSSSKSAYRSNAVIIATGFFDIPNRLKIAGEELDKVSHYFEDAHFYANQKVVIVGGNNSAVDAALSCYRAGAHVTMVMRGPSIGERVKYWVRPEIINRIEDQSISAYYESTLEEIQDNHVVIKTVSKSLTIENDFVLLMTGYRPDYDFLHRIGVSIDQDPNKTPICDEHTLESSVSGLYLAGVVLGGLKTNLWYIENSREHAERICDHIEKQKEAYA
ncbi:MAG: YpdA family putative bacillithiol disulfide reductase [Bacteroidetes bacterium]|nr:YpdA family putative bacillithiol disulfide reductase [Bacteroidota bacterium]